MPLQPLRALLLVAGMMSAASTSVGSQRNANDRDDIDPHRFTAAAHATTSATARVAPFTNAPLAFRRVLAGTSIDRLHWRSFDHVRAAGVPLDAPTTRARHVVVIDPGHGGSDPGARGANGVLEKHLTLDIARRAALFLAEIDDIEVILTRDGDHGMSRQSRVDRIRASGADLVLSLHLNDLPQTQVNLVETYYADIDNLGESRAVQRAEKLGLDIDRASLLPVAGQGDADQRLALASESIATILQRRLYDEVSRDVAGVQDAGVKTDTLYVLTRSAIPGALVELGCLSNPEEAARMSREEWRNRLAAVLADSVRDYFRTGAGQGLSL